MQELCKDSTRPDLDILNVPILYIVTNSKITMLSPCIRYADPTFKFEFKFGRGASSHAETSLGNNFWLTISCHFLPRKFLDCTFLYWPCVSSSCRWWPSNTQCSDCSLPCSVSNCCMSLWHVFSSLWISSTIVCQYVFRSSVAKTSFCQSSVFSCKELSQS